MDLTEILNPGSALFAKLQTLIPLNDESLFNLITSLGIKSQNLENVLTELMINSDEHGGGINIFLYGHWGKKLFFVFQDQGEGIHETIPKNQRLSDTRGKSSVSLLRLAMEEGITGTGTIGRGMGLFYLAQFVK